MLLFTDEIALVQHFCDNSELHSPKSIVNPIRRIIRDKPFVTFTRHIAVTLEGMDPLNLISPQKNVFPSKLLAMVDNVEEVMEIPIIVTHYRDTMFRVVDGNHRAALAFILGRTLKCIEIGYDEGFTPA